MKLLNSPITAAADSLPITQTLNRMQLETIKGKQ